MAVSVLVDAGNIELQKKHKYTILAAELFIAGDK